MPYRQESATVSAIRLIRDHSRECHNLSAREVLLRIERRMIEFLEDGPVPSTHGSRSNERQHTPA